MSAEIDSEAAYWRERYSKLRQRVMGQVERLGNQIKGTRLDRFSLRSVKVELEKAARK